MIGTRKKRLGKDSCHRLAVTRWSFNFPAGFSETSSRDGAALREHFTTIASRRGQPEDERLRETERKGRRREREVSG